MAFTYDLGSSDADILLISRLRLEIGDKTVDEGVLPEGKNFSDEELQVLLTRGGSDVERAAAFAFSILASAWATYADITIGPRREALSQISSRFEKRSMEYRTRLGMDSMAFSAGLKRADGYELLYPNEEY